MRKKRRYFFKPIIVSALLTAAVVFCATNIARILLPHTVSGYILYADENKNAAVRKSGGIAAIAGKALYIALGADFSAVKIAESVSGNIIFDEEKPTVIDDSEPSHADPSADIGKTTPEAAIIPKGASIIEKNINPSGGRTRIDEKISVNNETSYSATDASLTDGKSAFGISQNAKVLIYHTHTTESYSPDSEHDFVHTSPDRTTDTDYNVAAVGSRLAQELEKLGIGVIHIKDLYDYPKYNDSYARSCEGVQAVLKENPDIKIAIDLHRDAITTKEGQKTKITADINGEKVAQVMLVVGTDELGLAHENWRTNLKFAFDLQRSFLKISPQFARPVNLRTSRFNGHVAPGAVIIEVGAAGNTLAEAKASTPHIAKAIAEVAEHYRE